MPVILLLSVFSFWARAAEPERFGASGWVCQRPGQPIRLETAIGRTYLLKFAKPEVRARVKEILKNIYCSPMELDLETTEEKEILLVHAIDREEAAVGISPGAFLLSGLGWGQSLATQEWYVKEFRKFAEVNKEHLRARLINQPGDLLLVYVASSELSLRELNNRIQKTFAAGGGVSSFVATRLTLSHLGAKMTITGEEK